MMSVGSSRPRLGSISSREKRVKMAGTSSICATCLRHCRGADVVGNVALELVGRQPERSVVAGNCVDGVVAQQQQAGIAPAGDHFVAVRDEGSEERGCLAPIEIWHLPNIAL